MVTLVKDTANQTTLPPAHIMSVDVEDYFMVEAFAGSVPRGSWESRPSRVAMGTLRALNLFDRYNVKGTFFFVGWVARKFPELVREVHARGHELACHSYWHRMVYSLTPDEFRDDTRAAVKAIEDAAGVKVCGYRAPSWSITKDCLWALEILAEEGFAYDSSIYPIHHDLRGARRATLSICPQPEERQVVARISSNHSEGSWTKSPRRRWRLLENTSACIY